MTVRPMRYNVILDGDRPSKIDFLVQKLGAPSRNNAIGLCIDYCYEVMAKGKVNSDAIPLLYYKDQIDVLKKEQKKISRELLKSTNDDEKEMLRKRSKDIREQLNMARELYKFEADVEGNISDSIERIKIAMAKERDKVVKNNMAKKLALEVFKTQMELIKKGNINPEDVDKLGKDILESDNNENEYLGYTETDE